MMLRDNLYVLVSNWLEVFQVQTLDTSTPMNMLSWGLGFGTCFLFWLYLYFMYRREEESKNDQNPSTGIPWPQQAMWVGFLALLTGMLPVWMTNRLASGGTYSDRLAVPAMIGASIFIAGLLYAFLSKPSHRALILAILVGLSVGFHLRVANEYRWNWTAQQRFYWQLYWRAPQIRPGTPILSENALFPFVTKYSLASAINSLLC